jgi:hypothetical protein
LISLYVLKGEQVVLSKLDILKPSWTLRGEFIWGGVLFNQRKSIWNKGTKFQILKMLRKNLTHLSLTICKKTLKRIYKKRICKNKTCGANVVQYVKNKETIHAHLVSNIYWLNFKQPLHYIMQTSSIMHFYICFGLCWHQSPKRGRLKGN